MAITAKRKATSARSVDKTAVKSVAELTKKIAAPVLPREPDSEAADASFTITATQPSRPPRTLKYGDTFVVLDNRGDIGKSAEGAGGLFHQATRHLSCLELLVNDKSP